MEPLPGLYRFEADFGASFPVNIGKLSDSPLNTLNTLSPNSVNESCVRLVDLIATRRVSEGLGAARPF
jgi:hypothetical protein